MRVSVAIISVLVTLCAAQECGVTPDWEAKELAASEASRRLQTTTPFARSSELGPIRIYAHYLDMSALDSTTVTRIKTVIMPGVLAWFASVLSVHNLIENWKLSQTSCGTSVTVPDVHLTPGLPDVDYVVYVFALSDSAGTYAARAGACAFDTASTLQNPIAGTFQFNSLKWTATLGVESEISLARHEMTHALVFGSSMFPRYRSPDGTLLTNPVVTATLRGGSVSLLATPKVVEKARAAFGCATLTGLDLENQGGSGTAGSHWEKRIMLNDYMVGLKSLESIYSDITLAAFEDSGWYSVNYDYTDQILYGRNRGCVYFESMCLVGGVAQFPEFCDTATDVICDIYQTRKGYCSFRTYTSAIPTAYQYFSDPLQGGADMYPDYCPYVWTYSNGDCTGRNGVATVMNPVDYGEKACDTCRCFTGTYLKSGRTASGDPNHTGCHQVTCDGSTATVLIGTTSIVCPAAGGDVTSITGFSGSIKCPPYEKLCGPNPCVNGCFGYGKCVSGACVCADGHSGVDCSVLCDATCKSCSGTSASECLSCYAGITLSGTTCPCDSGLIFNPTTKTCAAYSESCDVTCATCSGPASTQCSTCVENATRVSGRCACNSGFSRSADSATCVACAGTCASCSTPQSSACTSCKANAALPAGQTTGACTCNSGYYLAADSSCQSCHSQCLTCTSGESTACQTCKTAAATVTNGSCVCPTGQYLSTDGSQCANCDPNCKTCNGAGSSACTACFGSAVVNAGVCQCPTAFYYTASGCLACDTTCQTCSGAAATNCLSCYSGSPSGAGTCQCGPGTYLTLAGACEVCSENCKVCSDQATKCTSCDSAVAQLVGTQCQCLSSAYLSASTRCVPCHATCLTCSADSDTSCLTCVTHATKTAGSCVCDPGFVRAADSKSCVACHSSCATCSGTSASSCQSCHSNASLSSSVCTCNSGFYMSADGSCGLCSPKCLTCSGAEASNCQSCKTGIALQGTTCVCPALMYLSADGTQCGKCDPTCLTCASSTAADCLTCYPLATLSAVPGTCVCPSSYYYTQPSGCLRCYSGCKECAGPLATQCTDCFAPAMLMGAAPSSCSCADGQIISDQGICQACSPNCKTCVDSQSKCSSCNSAVAVLSGTECVCVSTAFKSASGACVACDQSCVTCSAASVAGCLTCGDNALITSVPGACECAPGYFPNPVATACARCALLCKVCTSATQCTQCFAPSTLSAGACACPVGYFTDAGTCKSCAATCKACRGPLDTDCTDCFAQAALSSSAPSQCQCVAGTVPKPTVASCGSANCDVSCKTCSAASLESCSSCHANAVAKSGAFPSACVCGSGYFPSPDAANCGSCDASCLTCSKQSPFFCTSCKKVLVSGAYCADSCPSGQAAKGGVCVAQGNALAFRVQMDKVATALVDSVSLAQVQSGSAAEADTSDPVAYYRQGWLFDGADDYLTLPPNSLNSSTPLLLDSTHTAEFWVRAAAMSEVGCVLSKYVSSVLVLRFCVTDTSQLLLEFAAASATDPQASVTKLVIAGSVQKAWTAVGYQVKLMADRSTKVSLFVNQKAVYSDSLDGAVFRDTLGAADTTKISIGCAYKAGSRSNFFKGSVAEASLYNADAALSAGSCGCSACSTGNLCLSSCQSSEYQSLSGCSACQSSCASGCVRGTDCRANVDPLCSVFTSFVGCSQCFDLAELAATGCQCVANAQVAGGVCQCATGFQRADNKCVQCRAHFTPAQVNAYFDPSFMKLIIAFEKAVVSTAADTCEKLMTAEATAKLGVGYSCAWAADELIVSVVLGTNSTIVAEKLSLNYVNLYARTGNCSYTAVPLSPVLAYKFPLPEVSAKLNVPDTFSLTCSSSDLVLDGSASTGGKGRSLAFTWSLKSSPPLSAFAKYESYSTSDPFLRFPKDTLANATLTIALTARNSFGKESTAIATVSITTGAAITLEVDGGSPVLLKSSTRGTVKVKPVDLCSTSSALQYRWAFVQQTAGAFPFLSTPSPPNTITIPANTLKAGTNYTFSVSATDGAAKGSVTFVISVPASPLVVQLDRTDSDVNKANNYVISGDKSVDPDGLPGTLAYQWSCAETGKDCTDASGNLLLRGETKATLTLPAAKLKEGAVWSLTLTVSKDTRTASKSVQVKVKSSTVADFSQQVPTPERVNPQLALELKLDVNASPGTKFQWTQIFGNSLKPITPTRYAYLILGENTMTSGAAYGFSLTATNADGQSSAQIYFQANNPPSGGGATILPLSGTALQTNFQVVGANWEDIDGDIPLVYGVTYLSAGRDVAVGSRCRSNVKDFKIAGGTYQFVLSVYDSLFAITRVDLPVVTVRSPSRALSDVNVLASFFADTIDSDVIYEMVAAYSYVFQFDEETFQGVFATLRNYISMFTVLDSSEVDASLSSLESLFTQKGVLSFQTLTGLLSLLQQVIDKSESSLTSSQLSHISSILARYPGTSDSEVTLVSNFLYDLADSVGSTLLPDQDPVVLASVYTRKVSSGVLDGLTVSIGGAAVSLPAAISSEIGFAPDDVFDVRVQTSLYPNATSPELNLSLLSSGHFVLHAYVSYSASSAISGKSSSGVLISLPLANYTSNSTYQCQCKAANGRWSSAGVNLTAVADGSAVCNASRFSAFRVAEVAPTPQVQGPVPAGLDISDSGSCDPNYAPIAIASATGLLGLVIAASLLVCETLLKKQVLDQGTRYEQRVDVEAQILSDKLPPAPSSRPNTTEGAIIETQVPLPRSCLRVFLESHYSIGLFLSSSDLPRAVKALALSAALTVEMCIVGIFYESSEDQNSHSLKEIWAGYSRRDFSYAVVGLVVGLGVSLLLTVMFTVGARLQRAVAMWAVCVSIAVLLAAVAGAVYLASQLCFEAGGRWAISFLVVVCGEVLVCESLLALARVGALRVLGS